MDWIIVRYLYEDGGARQQLPLYQQVVQILARFAKECGDGTTISEALLKLVFDSAQLWCFIVSGYGSELRDTNFCKWLKQDKKLAIFENAEITIAMVEDAISLADPANSNDEDRDAAVAPVQTIVPRARTQPTPYKGDYVSPQRPAGSPPPTTFTKIALAILFHMIATSRDGKTLATLSASSVHTTIYKDYQVSRPEVARGLFHYFAREILDALPQNFRAAKIGTDLAALAANPPPDRIRCADATKDEKANDQYQKVRCGELILAQRGVTVRTGGAGGGGGRGGFGVGVGVGVTPLPRSSSSAPPPIQLPDHPRPTGVIPESELRPRIKMSKMYSF